MVKNETQEKYMRETFIRATASLLKGEGLRAVSTRNIAAQAGYSYATLYNYFHDVKDLVFECVLGFQTEIQTEVEAGTEGMEPGTARLRRVLERYIRYFVQYPGIYELFFLEPVHGLGGKNRIQATLTSFLDELCGDDWETLRSGGMNSRWIREKQLLLQTSIPGLLLWYLNRKEPRDYQVFQERQSELLDLILRD